MWLAFDNELNVYDLYTMNQLGVASDASSQVKWSFEHKNRINPYQ